MSELTPAVFAVKRDYHIMQYSEQSCLMWVKVGDKCYYDEVNGILRSDTVVHRVVVPMEELNAAKCYTVCLQTVIARKPYFPELEAVREYTYEFRPVTEKEKVRAYHVADAHNWAEGPAAAAEAYGDFDFLIMNGDIPDHSGAIEKCITIYELASMITGGQIPIVFARGNHDMRGFYAEKFGEHTPTDHGESYYTFRLGAIWGMVLDCGEDKVDEHPEYGSTICCHLFRERETEFMKNVITQAEDEYLAEGIKYRIVVSHIPFTQRKANPTFDIENEVYSEWVTLLSEHIRPDVIINGHLHRIDISYPGDESDHRGQPCPVVIGAALKAGHEYYAGTGFSFDDEGIVVTFTNHFGEIEKEEKLKRK